MSADLIQGLVIRQQAGFYAVFAENREIVCKLRGKIKEKKTNEDLAAIGDRVFITLLSPNEGVIEKVLPREKAFSVWRPPRGVHTNRSCSPTPTKYSWFSLAPNPLPACACWIVFS
jgi:hypothetical protein